MKKILLVEGNLREANQEFTDNGIKTHTESLRESIDYFTNNLEIDSVNPSSDKNIFETVKDLNKYDGLIWGGSSLNIYSDTLEIRRQIEFMKECQKKVKKALPIGFNDIMNIMLFPLAGERFQPPLLMLDYRLYPISCKT